MNPMSKTVEPQSQKMQQKQAKRTALRIGDGEDSLGTWHLIPDAWCLHCTPDGGERECEAAIGVAGSEMASLPSLLSLTCDRMAAPSMAFSRDVPPARLRVAHRTSSNNFSDMKRSLTHQRTDAARPSILF